MTLLHKHKINGGFLAPDRVPMEERNKNEMILELQNEVHTKDKEIERLKKENKKYNKWIESLNKNNHRLNNIINELEEYLNRFLYMLNGILDKDIYEQCQLDDFTMIMEKLQELKGSDKE